MAVGISSIKGFFRPKLVNHVPGESRVYRNCLGYEKKISYGYGSAEGKNRIISIGNNFVVRITNPIISSLNVCKSFLGIPVVAAKKTFISDGVNAVTKKAKGFLRSAVDENVGYTYSHAFFKKRVKNLR